MYRIGLWLLWGMADFMAFSTLYNVKSRTAAGFDLRTSGLYYLGRAVLIVTPCCFSHKRIPRRICSASEIPSRSRICCRAAFKSAGSAKVKSFNGATQRFPLRQQVNARAQGESRPASISCSFSPQHSSRRETLIETSASITLSSCAPVWARSSVKRSMSLSEPPEVNHEKSCGEQPNGSGFRYGCRRCTVDEHGEGNATLGGYTARAGVWTEPK
jgi:hypothetical protein